jgi:putative tryptophan/tyrosine transport system substrate-binding protein
MIATLKRREFIGLLGGAVTWPLAARAQQSERMRRIGVLTPWASNDAEAQDRVTAFVQAMEQLGWTAGRSVRIDYRWGDGKADMTRKYATELVALAPDVILALSSAAVAPLLEASRTVPIVFAGVADPVAAGYVESLARPGGNVTGFTLYEYSIGGKWLELLKEISPRVTRAAVLRETGIAAGPGLFGAIQALAPSLGLELRLVNVQDAAEIERAVAAFAQVSNGGMIVTGSPRQSAYRELIIALAAKHRLPAVYNARFFVAAGGLISYGTDLLDQSRSAARYVDRILKGEEPANLPVQAPNKYELVVNLKTAKALGLEMPTTVLARTDEVIE